MQLKFTGFGIIRVCSNKFESCSGSQQTSPSIFHVSSEQLLTTWLLMKVIKFSQTRYWTNLFVIIFYEHGLLCLVVRVESCMLFSQWVVSFFALALFTCGFIYLMLFTLTYVQHTTDLWISYSGKKGYFLCLSLDIWYGMNKQALSRIND